jgi:hypothetical protein
MAFAIASWPSFSMTEALGRAPPRDEPGASRSRRSSSVSLSSTTCSAAESNSGSSTSGGMRLPPSSRRNGPPSFSAKRSAPGRASSSTNKGKSKIPLDSQITMSFVLYRIGSIQNCPGCSGTRKITEAATPMRNSILKIRVIAYFVLDRGRQNDIKPNDFERDRNNGKPVSDAGRF